MLTKYFNHNRHLDKSRFWFNIITQSKTFLPRVVAADEACDVGVASSPVGRTPDEGRLFPARIDRKPRFCKDDPISDMSSKDIPIGTGNKKPSGCWGFEARGILTLLFPGEFCSGMLSWFPALAGYCLLGLVDIEFLLYPASCLDMRVDEKIGPFLEI